MQEYIEQIKQELLSKLNKLKSEVRNMRENDLRAEYEGHVGIYYSDDLYDMEFHNLIIYKNNKLIAQEQLESKITEEELYSRLKDYVKKKKSQEREQ